MVLGKSSDTINHTNGPKLKEYPPATPNTDRVANTFPRMDISPPPFTKVTKYANDSTNRENAMMLIPKSRRYRLPYISTRLIV
mmetsp:Transcript_708/g.1129  ORF Transcript_708/g.1129 Transcript_708/m.1129 type:complete len:83 (+) Transcript_708:495-743(+)